jgi:hypothetical protein
VEKGRGGKFQGPNSKLQISSNTKIIKRRLDKNDFSHDWIFPVWYLFGVCDLDLGGF